MAGGVQTALPWLVAVAWSACLVAGCGRAVATPTPTATPPVSPAPTASPTPTPRSTPPAGPASPPTFAVPAIPTPDDGATPAWHQAVALFHEGLTLQFQGRLEEAVTAYKRSIETFPIAEAYTYLGWTYSWTDRFEEAIQEAKRAIELDPDYGNPYNDIGVYLIALGLSDDAIPWLIKASVAERYEEPQFPHLNMGRIWLQKGQLDQAFTSFEMVLLVRPDYPLPPLPSLVMELPPFSGEVVGPSNEATMSEVAQAMKGYLEAWNAYDPAALLGMTAEHSPAAKMALLLNLAGAKLNRHRVHLAGVEPLYLGEEAAVVRARLGGGGVVLPVPYVLKRGEGGWKVMGIAVMRPQADRGGPKNGEG